MPVPCSIGRLRRCRVWIEVQRPGNQTRGWRGNADCNPEARVSIRQSPARQVGQSGIGYPGVSFAGRGRACRTTPKAWSAKLSSGTHPRAAAKLSGVAQTGSLPYRRLTTCDGALAKRRALVGPGSSSDRPPTPTASRRNSRLPICATPKATPARSRSPRSWRNFQSNLRVTDASSAA